jgi:hypothetical protein
MATNKPIPVRLRPVMHAYLAELDRIGGFGEGKAAIIRRFVENGIAIAIRDKVLDKKNAADLGEKLDDDSQDASEAG